jgi:hypothetical protein
MLLVSASTLLVFTDHLPLPFPRQATSKNRFNRLIKYRKTRHLFSCDRAKRSILRVKRGLFDTAERVPSSVHTLRVFDAIGNCYNDPSDSVMIAM